MRGVRLISILIVLVVLSLSSFAAPTAPPFQMDGIGGSTDEPEEVPNTSSEETLISEKSLPQNPALPGNADSSADSNSEPQFQATTSSSASNNWLIAIFVMLTLNFILLLIVVLGSSIHILKGKHPYLAFKHSSADKDLPEYKNTPDAIQYTETFQKLEGYMLQYMNQYSYDQIKTVLLNEGFTEDEIEAVYLEVRKNAK